MDEMYGKVNRISVMDILSVWEELGGSHFLMAQMVGKIRFEMDLNTVKSD